MVKSKTSMTATLENEVVDTSYWLQHRPGDPRGEDAYVPSIDRILASDVFPDDFLQHPEYYLPDTRSADGRETIRILKSVQGNPDAKVTVYRGTPGNSLNTGDWVTLSRGYAEIYAGDGAYSDNPNSKVISFEVRAGDLSFDGDSLFEFGYWGVRLHGR